MRWTALLKSTMWKRVGLWREERVGAHWSSSWYTFSLEASLPTAIVWTDRYQSSVCHKQNGQRESCVWFWPIHDASLAFFSRHRSSLFPDHVRLIFAQPCFRDSPAISEPEASYSLLGVGVCTQPEILKYSSTTHKNLFKIIIFLPIFEVFFIVRLSSKY